MNIVGATHGICESILAYDTEQTEEQTTVKMAKEQAGKNSLLFVFVMLLHSSLFILRIWISVTFSEKSSTPPTNPPTTCAFRRLKPSNSAALDTARHTNQNISLIT